MDNNVILIDIICILLSRGYIGSHEVVIVSRLSRYMYSCIVRGGALYTTLSRMYLVRYITMLHRLKVLSPTSSPLYLPLQGLTQISQQQLHAITTQQQSNNHHLNQPSLSTCIKLASNLYDLHNLLDSFPSNQHLYHLLLSTDSYSSLIQSTIIQQQSNNNLNNNKSQTTTNNIYNNLSYIDRLQSYLILSNNISTLSFILKVMISLQSINMFKLPSQQSNNNLNTLNNNNLRLSNQSLQQQHNHINQLPIISEIGVFSNVLGIKYGVGELSPIPLMIATSSGNGIAVKLLLGYPTLYNAHVKLGGCLRNPLFLASTREIALTLLQQRTRTDQPDVYGMLPVHYQALNGNLEVIKCLLDDSTINAQDLTQNTPLHWASLNGHLAVIKLLVGSGARFNVANANQRHPIHNSALQGHLDVTKYFIELYGRASSSSNGIRTSNGSRGISIQLPDKENNTPIDLAILGNHFQITLELLRYEGVIVQRSEIDLTNANRIGSGAFADVYQIRWRDRLVAVKKVKYDRLLESGKSDHWIISKFILEVALMVKLSHLSSFVKLFGVVIENNNSNELLLILEYCKYGSLYNILNTIGNDQLIQSLPSINILAQSMAYGMTYLHGLTPQIIHRDLTSQNILLDSNGASKIADFGISRFKNEIGDKTMTSIGNPRWRAPEVTKGEKYSEKVDVFGFGMILYEMFTRRYPFHEYEPVQASFKIASGERPSIPPHVDSRWAKLIQRCWDQLPINRPSFADITNTIQQLPIASIKPFTDPQMSSVLLSPSSSTATNTTYNNTDISMSDGSYEVD